MRTSSGWVLRGVAAAALLGAALAGAPAAHADTGGAAADTTRPAWAVRPHVGYAVGSVISAADYGGDGFDSFTTAQRIARWRAADPSGICGYSVYLTFPGDFPQLLQSGGPALRSYQRALSDYNGDFGGGSITPDGFQVRARDCAGNIATTRVQGQVSLVQEDGRILYGEQSTPPTYTGTWSGVTCACASGGTMRQTSQAGARMTYTATFAVGRHVALVMAKGPERGAAQVYLDGRLMATVDTFAEVNTNRVVVFDRQVTGRHTVTVVNLATAGRPRIDVDALLL